MLEIDLRLGEAVSLFNRQEYFACHDVLEEVWSETLGEDRNFYQGLIHAAVALFHFSEGNLGGARKMFDSQQRYLKPYGPFHKGLDLDGLQKQMERSFRDLLLARAGYPANVIFHSESAPQLTTASQDTP